MDFIAGFLELTGLWVIGNKNRFGFVFNFICCVLWIIYVLTSGHTYGLLLVVVPAAFINVQNFIKWSKSNNIKE